MVAQPGDDGGDVVLTRLFRPPVDGQNAALPSLGGARTVLLVMRECASAARAAAR